MDGRIEERILAVEKEITKVNEDILEAFDQSKAAADKEERDYWRKKEEQLRKKEEQLRKKEELLLEERARLQFEDRRPTVDDEDASAAKRQAAGRLEIPKELSDFWQHLPAAEWSKDGSVLMLAKGTNFLGEQKLGSSFFLRDCYPKLEKNLESIFASGGQAVAVIGNPGIGKTYFGYLLLYRWACEGRRVVVVKNWDLPPTLFTKEGVSAPATHYLDKVLSDPDARFLLDGVNPQKSGLRPPQGAQMIVVTSPDRTVYHEAFKREGYELRYMDVWSWEELEACRSALYSSQTTDDVLARYERWGGIARYVLQKISQSHQDLLDEAISGCTLSSLQQAISGAEASPELSNRVLHLRVGPDFIKKWLAFASPYVAEQVANKLLKAKQDELRIFLDISAGDSQMAALRGGLWEPFCHARLAKGGIFAVRDLESTSSPVTHMSLPPSSPSTPTVFDHWPSDFSTKPDGQYCKPRSKRNPADDSASQPNTLYQVTVGEKHPLNCAGLKEATDSMRGQGPVHLYFVLPPDRFMIFKKQTIEKGTGVDGLRQRVKQYALQISFSE